MEHAYLRALVGKGVPRDSRPSGTLSGRYRYQPGVVLIVILALLMPIRKDILGVQ